MADLDNQKYKACRDCVGILCLVLLECVAMLTEHDGAFFLPVVAVVAYIVGYKTPMDFFNTKKAE